MFEIEVRDEFSAAHFLKLYDGTWEHRHGHNWKVAVVMRSEKLDSMGVVADFEALKKELKEVLAGFQKISINDRPEFKNEKMNPSTENIAKLICEKLTSLVPSVHAKITRVTVWETEGASASYIP